MVNCEVCNREMEGEYSDYICCGGYMCGCYGKPTEPIACSMWCMCYAYHIREGKLSVIKNYIHCLFINTRLGEYIRKLRFNRQMRKLKFIKRVGF